MPLLLNIELLHAYVYIVLFYPYACKAIAFIEYMHFFLILKKKNSNNFPLNSLKNNLGYKFKGKNITFELRRNIKTN